MITLADITAKVAPEILDTHDTQAITDAFNAGRTKIAKTLGGIGTVLETLGPVDGADLLDGLEAMTPSVPALKWAFTLINRGELDFGSPATRGMIDTLVTGGVMPEVVGALLKAVAEVPDPVSASRIANILNGSE